MKRQALLVACVLLLSGCVAEQQEPEPVTTADTAHQMDSTMMMGGTENSGDQQFLMNMSNHHAGMIAMAADAMTRASDDSVKSAARSMHDKQRAQQDSMVMMMQQMHGVQHTPTVMPMNAAQADSLRQMTGPAVDEYFLRSTIYHHAEGIQMVDMYLPRLTDPQVRRMAEAMKTEQQREVRELEGKLQSL